jgi:hypothetical protein
MPAGSPGSPRRTTLARSGGNASSSALSRKRVRGVRTCKPPFGRVRFASRSRRRSERRQRRSLTESARAPSPLAAVIPIEQASCASTRRRSSGTSCRTSELAASVRSPTWICSITQTGCEPTACSEHRPPSIRSHPRRHAPGGSTWLDRCQPMCQPRAADGHGSPSRARA